MSIMKKVLKQKRRMFMIIILTICVLFSGLYMNIGYYRAEDTATDTTEQKDVPVEEVENPAVLSDEGIETQAATVTELTKGTFRLRVTAEGRYQIYVKNVIQYYGNDNGANATVIRYILDGREYILNTVYLGTNPSTDTITKGLFTCVSNTSNGVDSIVTEYTVDVPIFAGAGVESTENMTVQLKQTLTIYDTYIKKDFDVTFDRDVSGKRLLHGGDTYFGGNDSGFPAYNPLNNSVYIIPRDSSSTSDKNLNAGMMQFSGDLETPATQYFAGSYSTGNSQAKTGKLSNTATGITSTSSVDGGYYLGWDDDNVSSTMIVRSTERFINEAGALQILAPGPVNASKYSDFSADFTAINISKVDVTASLSAICPGDNIEIYQGNLKVTEITLAPNQTLNLQIRGRTPSTGTGGDIKLIASFDYSGTTKTYTAQTSMVLKEGTEPTITSASLTGQTIDTLDYNVTVNRTGIAVRLELFDISDTGTVVSEVTDTFTPSAETTTRQLTGLKSKLTGGVQYQLRLYIAGNTTPNTTVTFIQWSDAAPSTLKAVAANGSAFTDGKIQGATTEMEWRKEGVSTYTSVTGTEITGLAPGTYYVRYKNTTGETNGWHLLSADTSVTIVKKTNTVSLGTITNGSWTSTAPGSILDASSTTATVSIASGYELKQSNIAYSGTATITYNSSTNTITLSNVKSSGALTATCTKTQATLDREAVESELTKLKSAVTLDSLQAINTDLYTKIYNDGATRNNEITYAFANTTYTTGDKVTSYNNTATDQSVTLTVTLTKGATTKTKDITLTFPKENVSPTIEEINTQKLNNGTVAKILNVLTFNNFYNETIKVTVKAKDENSGVEKIYYSTVATNTPESVTVPTNWSVANADNSGQVTFNISPTFKGVIFAKAVDKAGNETLSSYIGKGSVIVENQAPIVTYTGNVSSTETNVFQKEAQTVSVKYEDTGTVSWLSQASLKVEKWNGTAYAEETSLSKSESYTADSKTSTDTLSTEITGSGKYKLTATATDQAGNTSSSVIRYINVDVDAPTISYSSSAPSDWTNSHDIIFNVSDRNIVNNSGLSKVSVIIDDTEEKGIQTFSEIVYDQEVQYKVVRNGEHSYKFKVEDNAGNSSVSAPYVVKFDKVVLDYPVVEMPDYNGENDGDIIWFKETKPNIIVHPLEQTGSAERFTVVQVNEEPEIVTSQPEDIEIANLLVEGRNIMKVSAYDTAGNTSGEEEKIQTYTVYVDTKNASVNSLMINGNERLTEDDIFYTNEDAKIVIKGYDETSGVSKIGYVLYEGHDENYYPSEKDWIYEDVNENDSVEIYITKEANVKIFAKVYDKAGNSQNLDYIESQLIVDKRNPDIQKINNNETYYVDMNFEIHETNLDKVEINDNMTHHYQISASQEKEMTHTIVVTDKAGNQTKYIVYTQPIQTLMTPLDNVTIENVNSNHLNMIKEIRQSLVDINSEYASEKQKEEIAEDIEYLDKLLDKVNQTQAMINDIQGKTESKDKANVNVDEEENLKQIQKDINDLLEGKNITEEEYQLLIHKKENVEEMLDQIGNIRQVYMEKLALEQKGQDVTSEELEKMESRIQEVMDVDIIINQNNVKEKIAVNSLIVALSAENIIKYSGQKISLELTVDYKENQGSLVGYQLIKNYDFNVYLDVNDRKEKQEVLKNPLLITIEIPQAYLGKEEYVVLRIHDGKKSLLSDQNISDMKNITIQTDCFSEYQLYYKGETDDSIHIETGDNTPIAVLVTLVIGNLIFIVALKKKRQFK